VRIHSFAGYSNSTEYLKQLNAFESALDHISSGSSNLHRPADAAVDTALELLSVNVK